LSNDGHGRFSLALFIQHYDTALLDDLGLNKIATNQSRSFSLNGVTRLADYNPATGVTYDPIRIPRRRTGAIPTERGTARK